MCLPLTGEVWQMSEGVSEANHGVKTFFRHVSDVCDVILETQPVAFLNDCWSKKIRQNISSKNQIIIVISTLQFITTNASVHRVNTEISLDLKIDSVFWVSNEDIGTVLH